MLLVAKQRLAVLLHHLVAIHGRVVCWVCGCLTLVCLSGAVLQRLVPEPRTFNIVMNACNSAGQYGDCISVHERMLGQNVSPTVGTYNAVLLAYCK